MDIVNIVFVEHSKTNRNPYSSFVKHILLQQFRKELVLLNLCGISLFLLSTLLLYTWCNLRAGPGITSPHLVSAPLSPVLPPGVSASRACSAISKLRNARMLGSCMRSSTSFLALEPPSRNMRSKSCAYTSHTQFAQPDMQQLSGGGGSCVRSNTNGGSQFRVAIKLAGRCLCYLEIVVVVCAACMRQPGGCDQRLWGLVTWPWRPVGRLQRTDSMNQAQVTDERWHWPGDCSDDWSQISNTDKKSISLRKLNARVSSVWTNPFTVRACTQNISCLRRNRKGFLVVYPPSWCIGYLNG